MYDLSSVEREKTATELLRKRTRTDVKVKSARMMIRTS